MIWISVYNDEGEEIGYLEAYNQQFYAFTMDDEPLPRAFFKKSSAEAYLREVVAASQPG